MKDIRITIFDGSELIKIAAALINVKHPVIERGEEAVTAYIESYG